MRLAVIGFAALALAGCDARRLADARELVRAELSDPKSAQFSDMRYFPPGRGPGGSVESVCGKVNSKNQFGGYTGPDEFVVAGGDVGLKSQFPEGWGELARLCGF